MANLEDEFPGVNLSDAAGGARAIDEPLDIVEWVANYRTAGLQVVPAVRPSDDQTNWKRPALSTWGEFQNDLIPETTIERWYGSGGAHRNRQNVGLLTGACSGGVFCVDLDIKEGMKADQWWAGLLATHNNDIEPETPWQRTGGGGRQFLFRAPAGWSPPTIKTPPGIDIRGQGGFMVAPPSIHESGKRYAWAPGRAPWECEVEDAPEWLIEAIDHLQEQYGGSHGSAGHRERTASPDAKNAFGLDVDDREQKIRDMVWAAVVDLYRDCPIPPTQAEQEIVLGRLWSQYLLTTKSRLTKPGVANADLLEMEGRGWSEFERKWRYAIRKWDKQVKLAAAEPKREAPAQDAVIPLSSSVRAPEKNQEETTNKEEQPREESAPSAPPEPPDFEPPFRASDLHGDAPDRQWIVPDWIVQGSVNSLYGDGGLGKTLLAQQLACSVSLGAPWLGMPTVKGGVLAVLCEDDKGELHRRHNDIKATMGYGVGNPFKDVWLWPRVGYDNTLMNWTTEAQRGRFAEALGQAVNEIRPSLLILDTLADFYGANEIDRVQVNYFVKVMLGGLIKAADWPLTVLLLGHPSVRGKESDDGFSGSTAWNNAVRSRLYLTKPKDAEADDRVLTRGKSNYAASGDETGIKLVYDNGVLRPVATADDGDSMLWVCLQEVIKEVDQAWLTDRPMMADKKHARFIYRVLIPRLAGRNFDRDLIKQAIQSAIDDNHVFNSNSNGKRGFRVRTAHFSND